jgi:hypothetical protein
MMRVCIAALVLSEVVAASSGQWQAGAVCPEPHSCNSSSDCGPFSSGDSKCCVGSNAQGLVNCSSSTNVTCNEHSYCAIPSLGSHQFHGLPELGACPEPHVCRKSSDCSPMSSGDSKCCVSSTAQGLVNCSSSINVICNEHSYCAIPSLGSHQFQGLPEFEACPEPHSCRNSSDCSPMSSGESKCCINPSSQGLVVSCPSSENVACNEHNYCAITSHRSLRR